MNKFARFLIAGLPAFAIAMPLNYFLVVKAGLTKPVAYALVLMVQVVINFFACHFFVFTPDPTVRMRRQFLIFFHGIILFRVADWGLYVLLTNKLGLPFLGVQLFNVATFSLMKYRFSKRVFEPKPAESNLRN